MGRRRITEVDVPLIAERFKALSEPSRIALLLAMRAGERTVTQLVTATQMSQANTSKHLQVLHTHGLVTRRKVGLFVYYAMAGRKAITLCELIRDPSPIS